MEIDSLAKYPLVYVASPYSKYPEGIEAAFREVSRVTGKLLQAGVKGYSPIAHTHPIALYAEIDPYDYDVWLPFDGAMMAASAAMVVVKMTGWDNSFGINHERDVFNAANKPIFELDPITFEVA